MSESQAIEYKESWRDEYIKWISGFANEYRITNFEYRSKKSRKVGNTFGGSKG